MPASHPLGPAYFARKTRRAASLSLRTWLVLVMLVPMAATVGFVTSAISNQWSSRDEALNLRQSSLRLDSLMLARSGVSDEEVPTTAIVYARGYGVSEAVLDSILKIDFSTDLRHARQVVNQQSVLRQTDSIAPIFARLQPLRIAVDRGTASYAETLGYFKQLTNAIDARIQGVSSEMTRAANASQSAATRDSLSAFRSVLTAYKAGGLQQTVVPQILLEKSSPAQVQELVASTEDFSSSVKGFPGQLGTRAAAAWRSITTSASTRAFDRSIQLAISTGLQRDPPPYASDPARGGAFFRADLATLTAQVGLVMAASEDLRMTTSSQESAATSSLIIDSAFFVLVLGMMLGGIAAISRSVGRPLARIVHASKAVRAGELELPYLEETGPKELSLATGAFNEMSSTLRAVHAQAVALAGGDLNDSLLRTPLPGETGKALQGALNRLLESVRENERQRQLLHDQATHDFLTGLLNRGGALEALERDMARVRRGGPSLGLMFIDLDGLKEINDTFGHEGGDAALRAVAGAIRSTTRASDVVARFGGDEFIVGRYGNGDLNGMTRLAERILHQVSGSVAHSATRPIEVGCSIGIAMSQPTDLTVDTLIDRADRALYMAKAEGGGRVRGLWAENPISPAEPSSHVPQRTITAP